MKMLFRLVLLLLLGALSAHTPATAQTDNLRAVIASMSQDVEILGRELRTLRLEMEEMRRENARLRAQVTAATANPEAQTQIANLSRAVEAVRREYRQADQAQKEQIISEVSRQMDALAKEMETAINAVANAVESAPRASAPTVTFSENYPKTGTTYTVRAGDTLSQIAREFGSTTRHIQNANKIVNPARDLRVGETIFIPIPE